MSDEYTQKLIIEQALIGRVITQATSIEHIINAYTAEFYTRCSSADYHETYLAFIYDIMNDRGISLDTKVTVLFKIYKRMFAAENKPSKTLFTSWLSIRNKFAHGTYVADKGILYGGEFFDVTELADKHAKLQIKVNLELERFVELRGPYFNYFPTKKRRC